MECLKSKCLREIQKQKVHTFIQVANLHLAFFFFKVKVLSLMVKWVQTIFIMTITAHNIKKDNSPWNENILLPASIFQQLMHFKYTSKQGKSFIPHLTTRCQYCEICSSRYGPVSWNTKLLIMHELHRVLP